jgi:hypothetical protein
VPGQQAWRDHVRQGMAMLQNDNTMFQVCDITAISLQQRRGTIEVGNCSLQLYPIGDSNEQPNYTAQTYKPSMTFVRESGNDTTKTGNIDWWGAEHRKKLKNALVSLKCAAFAPDDGASALL